MGGELDGDFYWHRRCVSVGVASCVHIETEESIGVDALLLKLIGGRTVAGQEAVDRTARPVCRIVDRIKLGWAWRLQNHVQLCAIDERPNGAYANHLSRHNGRRIGRHAVFKATGATVRPAPRVVCV